MRLVDILVGIIGLAISVTGAAWLLSIQWAHPEKTTRLLWVDHSADMMKSTCILVVGLGLIGAATGKK